ncbi:MAG: RCC1 domain-containing protein, partial [Luteolibacter sp.]
SWTPFGRYNQTGGTIQIDPSAPTVVIQSAAMRPGTTLMDVVYRVNDPDDATVKTRALAFVDGVRSFANVLKPVTFVEGTAAKLGDAIPSNTNHTLTWDVGADWNIALGQVKFEVLAMDGRGLLPIDWITIPAAGGKPALTISNSSPTNAEVLDALFWRYASADPGLTLTNGSLSGNAAADVFKTLNLANNDIPNTYAIPYILKNMNLDPASAGEVAYAAGARSGIQQLDQWHAVNRPWAGISPIVTWGYDVALPAGATDVIQMDASGSNLLVLNRDGSVAQFGGAGEPMPADLSGVIMVAAGDLHSVALKADGTVVCWGEDFSGQRTPPAGLSGVIAIAAGNNFSLALKSDRTVVGWGMNPLGQAAPPASWVDVTAISAGQTYALALKSNGTVVGWGSTFGGGAPPSGLTGVTAIAVGFSNSLALKIDKTIAAWGGNQVGESTPPSGLANVIGIAAGAGTNRSYCLAVLANGSVVGWGQQNPLNAMTPPAGLSDVISATVGSGFCAALRPKQL